MLPWAADEWLVAKARQQPPLQLLAIPPFLACVVVRAGGGGIAAWAACRKAGVGPGWGWGGLRADLKDGPRLWQLLALPPEIANELTARRHVISCVLGFSAELKIMNRRTPGTSPGPWRGWCPHRRRLLHQRAQLKSPQRRCHGAAGSALDSSDPWGSACRCVPPHCNDKANLALLHSMVSQPRWSLPQGYVGTFSGGIAVIGTAQGWLLRARLPGRPRHSQGVAPGGGARCARRPAGSFCAPLCVRHPRLRHSSLAWLRLG